MGGDRNSNNGWRAVVLPMILTEAMLASEMFVATTPWQAPYMLGIGGSPSARPSEHLSTVAFEWPVQIVSLAQPLDKPQLERMHLDRFVTDSLFSFGRVVLPGIEAVPAGQDPPDFRASIDGIDLGVDFAQVTIQERRHVNAAFRAIRGAILEQPRHRFAHLGGLTVYMWFGGGQNELSLPPRPQRREELDRIVDALANYRFDLEKYLAGGVENLPETIEIDEERFSTSAPGTTFYGMPMIGALPATEFFYRTGFEIGMSFPTSTTVEDTWSEIWRIAHSHDNDKTDVLIMTAGVPDSRGFAFPAEEYLVENALANGVPATPIFKHLSEIVIHLWSSGQIVYLYPEILCTAKPVFPGRYAVPSHGLTLETSNSQGNSFSLIRAVPK